MRIEIITVWYNEEFLAPFFLNYYKYVDKIHVIIDGNTTDKSEKICRNYNNVQIYHWNHVDEYNVWGKTDVLNSIINRLDCDWAYSLDADEFIFPETKEDPRIFLKRQEKFNVIFVKYYHVYRHFTEKDLDLSVPILLQRRYGNSNLKTRNDINPRIVRPEVRIKWTTACHYFEPNDKIEISENYFICSHWRMADADLAIRRMIHNRKDRQCEKYLRRGNRMDRAGTEEIIIEECNKHLNDPKVF